MVSLYKVAAVLSCSFLLCLGLPRGVHAEHSPAPGDVMKTDSLTDAKKFGFKSDDDKQRNVDEGKGGTAGGKSKTIKGQLFRVEDGNYFVKIKDGNEVQLHTDKTTKMMGEIKKGDQVEAKVNDRDHALSIRSISPKP
ncbi:MAG: hypothetical protein H8K04_08165 [Nitrospira sp.]